MAQLRNQRAKYGVIKEPESPLYPQLRNTDLGGCENCGPFLGPLYNTCNQGTREPKMV